jgi:hypothetical protein
VFVLTCECVHVTTLFYRLPSQAPWVPPEWPSMSGVVTGFDKYRTGLAKIADHAGIRQDIPNSILENPVTFQTTLTTKRVVEAHHDRHMTR